MHCIHCKTSPATNGQLCSSCILDIASRLKKDSSSIPVVENSTKMTKQKEALMRAKSQLMSKQSTVSPHQLVSKEIEIVKSSSQAPYELAKRKRVSAFTPKQPKKPNAFKPSPAAASKRTVPNTSIPVQCGFHVRVKVQLAGLILKASSSSSAFSLSFPSYPGNTLMPVMLQRFPPWVTKPILNTSDLSWDRFGTTELSVILTELNASDWSEGLWHELDPNGTEPVRLLVHYKLNWDQILFRTRKMRSYALARQFMALFCQAVSSAPRAASDLKNLSQALRIVDAFPVYLNPDTSKQNQQDTWQADPIGENPLEELRDEPTRGYFMSPAIMQLLSAFQHWICMYTNGQMIITNIQGVVPLLSKPKIIDLNPE
ncbi:hypothetical protein MJO28_017132 [Puccinia striiformis f. sp. tritici]|nr:hypothetical protein MJO28_017132 [Puccinia striiformis f. sp. tritici]